MGYTQGEISNLTTRVWQHERNKGVWQKIASIYTAARNNGQPGLVFSELTKAELAKSGCLTTPEEHLLRAGFIAHLVRGKSSKKRRVRKTAHRCRNEQASPAPYTVRRMGRPYFSPPPDVKLSDEAVLDSLDKFKLTKGIAATKEHSQAAATQGY